MSNEAAIRQRLREEGYDPDNVNDQVDRWADDYNQRQRDAAAEQHFTSAAQERQA